MLYEYLEKRFADTTVLTLQQIQDLLGFALPEPALTDPAWWADTGFVGRCPHCGGWVHFTVREKRAVTPEESTQFPQLPDDWYEKATVL